MPNRMKTQMCCKLCFARRAAIVGSKGVAPRPKTMPSVGSPIVYMTARTSFQNSNLYSSADKFGMEMGCGNPVISKSSLILIDSSGIGVVLDHFRVKWERTAAPNATLQRVDCCLAICFWPATAILAGHALHPPNVDPVPGLPQRSEGVLWTCATPLWNSNCGRYLGQSRNDAPFRPPDHRRVRCRHRYRARCCCKGSSSGRRPGGAHAAACDRGRLAVQGGHREGFSVCASASGRVSVCVKFSFSYCRVFFIFVTIRTPINPCGHL